MSNLSFITLRHPAMHKPAHTQCEHISSLSFGGRVAEDCGPDLLTVVGNLPHCAMFKPATAEDRDRLVSFLLGISYE